MTNRISKTIRGIRDAIPAGYLLGRTALGAGPPHLIKISTLLAQTTYQVLQSGNVLPNTLASGDIFVGNGSGVAAPVAMSGDATLANTGAITVTKSNGVAFGSAAFTASSAYDVAGAAATAQTNAEAYADTQDALRVLKAGDTMGGALQSIAGTITAPGFAVGEAGTGLYRPATGTLGFAVNDANSSFTFSNGGLALTRTGAGVSFTMDSDAGASVTVTRYSTNATSTNWLAQKAGGTKASPAAALQNYVIGNFLFLGRGSTAFKNSSAARATIIEPTPSDTAMGGRFSILTSPLGSVTLGEVSQFQSAYQNFLGPVTIGALAAPTASAALDISSTTGALLIPRMTTTQRTALTAANGMLVYDTTVPAFFRYTNGGWVQFTTPANPSATASDVAVNGSAVTYMRSDAAPAVQKASSSVFGIVKVDNTTITASGGVISAVGSGTVTSVSMTGDGVIFNASVTGSPITTSGTLAPSLHTQTANFGLMGPTTGSAAAPTFRALVTADIPDLSAVYATVASVPAAANPTATAKDTAVNGSATTYMRSDAAPAIQKASASQFGIVEVDGTSITATAGVISAVSGGGGVGSLSPGYPSGRIFTMPFTTDGGSLLTSSATTTYFSPVYMEKGTVLSNLYCQTTTTGGNVQSAIYTNSSGLPTGAPLATSSSTSNASSGVKAMAITYTVPTTGWYWIALQTSSSVNVHAFTDTSRVLGVPNSASSLSGSLNTSITQTGTTFGTFPNPPSVAYTLANCPVAGFST